MFKKILFALLIWPFFLLAQEKQNEVSENVTRYFYENQVVSAAIWYGADKKTDSSKTYYPTGNLNEVFYFDKDGLKDGDCFQYNNQGEKLVTWNFAHGKMTGRTDHKLPFAKDREESVKKALKMLTDINAKTNFNPANINDLYNRGVLGVSLGNNTLAIEDLKKVEYSIDKDPKNKNLVLADSAQKKTAVFRSKLYDRMASVYAQLEMDGFAFNYYYKAIRNAPDDYRILFNFATLLQKRKINDLAYHYFEKIIKEKPNQPQSYWAISRLLTEMGEYKKAFENIEKAFQYDKENPEKRPSYGGRDLKSIRGLLYHKLGESKKGIADLKAALETNKENAYAMKNLGIIYLDQKKYDEACQLFQKAKELNYSQIYDENDLDALLESACNKYPLEKSSKTKLFISPNPAQTTISVENLNSKNFDFEFFNFESKSVLKGKTSEGTINIIALESGFYVLKVTFGDSAETFKVIKE
ncbi:T9SS type A sorting domain-containing protein [Flavobacterium defluvii]|uniref:Por secretion system C-terminal sorting domain-containing protein n=1 Tax=Flavobacterium defluvii TaxID=370979 RepID=A0A1M5L3I8_9FLAO|nr:T9SS type A sorting domain-containing protein [Flavobacterium defluvii]SHG58983.1 Por secretion system C-terminal sorting domain-containing protein [Flavobacterium defluvii]